jgi:hypothetical protein
MLVLTQPDAAPRPYNRCILSDGPAIISRSPPIVRTEDAPGVHSRRLTTTRTQPGTDISRSCDDRVGSVLRAGRSPHYPHRPATPVGMDFIPIVRIPWNR